MSKRTVLTMALLAALTLVGCVPEDWTTRLPYAGPVEIGIPAGTRLPGTDVRYLGRNEGGARLVFGDREMTREIGDPVDWKGEMVEGVEVDETLRVILITDDTLQTAGTVRIIVTNPQPQAEEVNTSAGVHFTLPVGYHVKVGESIPGTEIRYLGKTEDGAQLDRPEGYDYRKLGDSIVWEGKLRPGLWIELDLRTALITEDQIDVLGTAGIWIEPSE
ncbi:MAG: hypothetical protein PVF47_09245 [Anaerolineae bacterium]|jgi:hypothetical protein